MKKVNDTGRAAEYALDFRTLAAEDGWNEPALKAVYRSRVKADRLKELALMVMEFHQELQHHHSLPRGFAKRS